MLLARGLTNVRIADELGVARRTVDTHVTNILHKLGLTSRSQVIEWVRQYGIPLLLAWIVLLLEHVHESACIGIAEQLSLT
jgi:orotate phosphoribosyltransferase-like protein